MSQSKKMLATALIITPSLFLASCGKSTVAQDHSTPTTQPETNSKDTTSISQTTDSSGAIVAGSSVTRDVTYSSPAGEEHVEFTLTTSGETITAVSAKPLATNPISKSFQTKFSDTITNQVVGKKKSELQLDAVGGASLTTDAFKQFVAAN